MAKQEINPYILSSLDNYVILENTDYSVAPYVAFTFGNNVGGSTVTITIEDGTSDAVILTGAPGNEISQIIITRDLDGGTRVSGNCDNEIVIKYGTRVTLDCDAIKNGKHLTGYIDQDGHEMSKNSFFSFAEPGYTELTIPGTKSLKAVKLKS